ncbi:MAG: hypothetical protein IKO78_01920 [Bacilli bacterium]|nr:hypothetical protein [Bacilli bacterium]
MADKKLERELRIIREKLADFEDTRVIDEKQYIDLVFATAKNYGQNTISLFAFALILGVIGESSEFDRVARRLDVRKIDLDDIYNSKYFRGKENGEDNVRFEMSYEDFEEIINRDPEATVAINNAMLKYNATLEMAFVSEGKCQLKNDDPNGEFTTAYYDEPGAESEEVAYTDGEIVDDGIFPDTEEPYTTERDFTVKNATYLIVTTESKGVVRGATVRGFAIGDFQNIIDETMKIKKGNHSGYKISIKDKPRAYTLHRN